MKPNGNPATPNRTAEELRLPAERSDMGAFPANSIQTSPNVAAPSEARTSTLVMQIADWSPTRRPDGKLWPGAHRSMTELGFLQGVGL